MSLWVKNVDLCPAAIIVAQYVTSCHIGPRNNGTRLYVILYGYVTMWLPKMAVFGKLTHWGRVTHICVSKLTIVGSDNGLSPGRCQAIICTNDGVLLIRTLRTNFSENVIEIHTFPSKKIHLKMSSGKWRPFRLGLNVLTKVFSCTICVNYIANSFNSMSHSVFNSMLNCPAIIHGRYLSTLVKVMHYPYQYWLMFKNIGLFLKENFLISITKRHLQHHMNLNLRVKVTSQKMKHIENELHI